MKLNKPMTDAQILALRDLWSRWHIASTYPTFERWIQSAIRTPDAPDSVHIRLAECGFYIREDGEVWN